MTTVTTNVAIVNALAGDIRREHEAAQAAASAAVGHAIRCGELLLQVKADLEHGAFGPWLTENVTFSDRTARGYMRLAGLDESKRQRVADMSLRGALATLAAPKAPRLEVDADDAFIAKIVQQGGPDTLAESLRVEAIRRRKLAVAQEAIRACDDPESLTPEERREAAGVVDDCQRMVREMIDRDDVPSPPGRYLGLNDVISHLILRDMQRDLDVLQRRLDAAIEEAA